MLGLPIEMITMFASTLGSGLLRMYADSRADLAAERKARAGMIQEARNYHNANANWTRRFITMSFIGMAFIILLAPLFNLPTVVPVEVTEGFKFLFLDFTNKITEYRTLEGMVTPEYLPHSIMAVVGFYFGNSITKR